MLPGKLVMCQPSVNNHIALNHQSLPVTEPPHLTGTKTALCTSVSVSCDLDPLHSPCYHHNASTLHQLNIGLLPLAWRETFKRGGVVQGVQVGAFCGWLVSLARMRNIINLHDAFWTVCVHICVQMSAFIVSYWWQNSLKRLGNK